MSESPLPRYESLEPDRPAPHEPPLEPVRENLDENGLPVPSPALRPGFQHGERPSLPQVLRPAVVPPRANRSFPAPAEPLPSPLPVQSPQETAPLAALPAVLPPAELLQPAPAPQTEPPAPRAEPPAVLRPFPLDDLLRRVAEIPGNLALLGKGSDGLPLILDLDDPAPGSLAAACEDASLREHLLRGVLLSACALNPVRAFQFFVLSSAPGRWRTWVEDMALGSHCLGVEGLPGPAGEGDGLPAMRWLIKLAALAEKRRSGTFSGPALLLIVDDLAAAARLDYEARVSFDRLVREGPVARMRCLAGVGLREADALARWVRIFETRICGSADGTLPPSPLFADNFLRLKPGQFAVQVAGQWLRFGLAELPAGQGGE